MSMSRHRLLEMTSIGVAVVGTALFGLAMVGCRIDGSKDLVSRAPKLSKTRGFIVISIDTLRADHLGAYGYQLETSPNFDRLAEDGILFERAIVQYPSTLTSHMSLFTGFYPQQHRVLPPSTVLAESIETIPERFLANGFRTAGHTEGGFVAGGYGFSRGFEQFTDTAYRADTDVERTFERGLEFLRTIEPDQSFFLFLHTYSVHDPYEPPEAYQKLFWDSEAPQGFVSSGENLRLVNRGELKLSEEGNDYFKAMYDASIRYVDDVLGKFVASLDDMGLLTETTIVITSDHGEEFLEHGKVAHTQIYPESVAVPLLVIHPDLTSGQRIKALVESVDLAPTLYQLAGIEVPPDLAGQSLVPLIEAGSGQNQRSQAYAEVLDVEFVYSLLAEDRDHLYQLLMVEPEFDPAGSWIRESVSFDTAEPTVRFEAHSFHEQRKVRVVLDGIEIDRLSIDPTWSFFDIELLPGEDIHRVRLEADGCLVPAEVGVGEDSRCLAFQMRGFSPRMFELYDLAIDPGAENDLYRIRSDVRDTLRSRLLDLQWQPLDSGGEKPLSPEDEETLRALGYLD